MQLTVSFDPKNNSDLVQVQTLLNVYNGLGVLRDTVPAAKEEIKVEPASSGEDLRAAAAKKAKELGETGPAKVKAFVAAQGVKSIVEIAPEQRQTVLDKLNALS